MRHPPLRHRSPYTRALQHQKKTGDPNHTATSSSVINTQLHSHNHHSHHHHHHDHTNANRTTATIPLPQHHQHQHPTYLYCAAPKSVLSQNCHFVRQLQRDLPPYPCDVGVYATASPRPSTLDVGPTATVTAATVSPSPTLGPKHPSILKHYKSCPVSPVREELDWSNVAAAAASAAAAPAPVAVDKRHSMYSDDAQTILDMIHSDTEKMIAEITQKYGDLDDFDPTVRKSSSAAELKPQIAPKPKVIPPPPASSSSKPPARRRHKQEHGFLSDDDDDHFSSDSLEDCSLDIDHPHAATGPRTPCRKHTRRPAGQAPKRSVSDYLIYDQPTAAFGMNPNRNVSLSDILYEDEHRQNAAEQSLMSAQRHSSASFFLGPHPETRKSQESLLSDENSAIGAGSYCNSMESILSDESECKSAPLEALFGRTGRLPRMHPGMAGGGCGGASGAPPNAYDTTSKSYGSSPNAGSSGFDFYMQHQQQQQHNYHRYADDLRMPVHDPVNVGSGGAGYPWITNAPDEFIPRLGQSGRQMVVSKSLSKEFADQRQQHSTNPMFDEPAPAPAPPRPHKRVDTVLLNDPSVYVMRKSCSFDIEMFDGRRIQRSAAKKYEQNLEKFELERQCRPGPTGGGTLAMEYVPHKPPVATRRSSSMRNRQRRQRDEKLAAVTAPPLQQQQPYQKCAASAQLLLMDGEKSFEIYVAEKGAAEDMDSVDSLEFYAKPTADLRQSADSLDAVADSVVSAEFLTAAEYTKFRDIEKKIDVINKLVELEERKLEHERLVKERRVQPFQCDIRQKGYVKSLTMNFDKLARQEATRRLRGDADDEEEDEARRRRRMKRNFSLPDVLEGAKFRTFVEHAEAGGGPDAGGEQTAERESRRGQLSGQRMGFREGLQQQ